MKPSLIRKEAVNRWLIRSGADEGGSDTDRDQDGGQRIAQSAIPPVVRLDARHQRVFAWIHGCARPSRFKTSATWLTAASARPG